MTTLGKSSIQMELSCSASGMVRSSTSARHPRSATVARTPGGSPAYDVAKAGVLRLTTMLAGLASEGIRVNCIAPDWIATPELQVYVDSLSPEQRSRNKVPSRLTTLDEISSAVVQLATDESLAGRVLVWWSDDVPRLIPWSDPGYASLELERNLGGDRPVTEGDQ